MDQAVGAKPKATLAAAVYVAGATAIAVLTRDVLLL
jgi:hypothetical protein